MVIPGQFDAAALGDRSALDQTAVIPLADSDVFITDGALDVVDVPRADSSVAVDVSSPLVPAPRPTMPISLSDVNLRRPTLRWELPAAVPQIDGAGLQLCRDRACTMVIKTLRTAETSARPTAPLAPNSVVFWRLRATLGAATGITYSPPWLFHVPATDNAGAWIRAQTHTLMSTEMASMILLLAAAPRLRAAGLTLGPRACFTEVPSGQR